MKWHTVNPDDQRYIDENGKIIGHVRQVHKDHWAARYGDNDIGAYIDSDSAKKAVELCRR